VEAQFCVANNCENEFSNDKICGCIWLIGYIHHLFAMSNNLWVLIICYSFQKQVRL
jgi:hypothetical protein